MTSALAERPADNLVTGDQLELVKRTVAQGATDAELKIYLYDCQRHGVHPLDRLLHFTKRGGKYTPITSIDLMRMRAHDTGECVGISDPSFELAGDGLAARPVAATCTVKRFVHGQIAEFTATARWSEYCPDNAPMWKRMPHTMLGKCAEALALRKGFPKQLAGLYAREEMDQAETQTTASAVPEPQAIPEPPAEGWDDWLTDLSAAADEGTAALEHAWKASAPKFKAHLTRHERATWEAIKTKAAQVKA